MTLGPTCACRVASLLQGGAVLGRCFQPYEAHIPFLLQFKVTLNLYGMDWLRLGKVLFRHPLPPAPLATRHEVSRSGPVCSPAPARAALHRRRIMRRCAARRRA